jgi:hypothetical protein
MDVGFTRCQGGEDFDFRFEGTPEPVVAVARCNERSRHRSFQPDPVQEVASFAGKNRCDASARPEEIDNEQIS